MTQFTVWWGSPWAPNAPPQHFSSFIAAEQYAHQCVRTLDERGCSTPAEIDRAGVTLATVRLDGNERSWTDIVQDNLI